jgi:endogenous inhibitor of DNA gyrase (YacG/DUF329 family)
MDKTSWPCPICTTEAEVDRAAGAGGLVMVECPRCGTFRMSGSANADLPSESNGWPSDWPARVSHALRKMERGGDDPFLKSYDIKNIVESRSLPDPNDQSDNLLLWAGELLRAYPR